MTELRLKRAYDPQEDSDGFRIYIDRLWPQGLSHETFHYDIWDKDIAPSKALRSRFHENRDANWPQFEKLYVEELQSNPSWPKFVELIEKYPCVTLLYSSKNTLENNAVIIYNLLLKSYSDSFYAYHQ